MNSGGEGVWEGKVGNVSNMGEIISSDNVFRFHTHQNI